MAVDAASLASQFAGFDVEPFETRYQNKISTAQSQVSAFSKIKTALDSLDDKIYDLNKYSTSIGKSSTTLSDDEFFDLTTSSSISNMNMDIFVEQLAASHQVIMDVDATEMDGAISAGGTFDITINGETNSLDLTLADEDSNGEISLSEFVDYFNANNEDISASVIRTDGQMKIMYTSIKTGTDNSFQISASPDSGLQAQATTANDNPVKTGRDAVIWLGGQGTGTKLVNDSNEYENVIQGVTINLKKAQPVGDETINTVVSPDASATQESIKELITIFNDTLSTINKYTTTGDEENSRGVLASDSSIKGLQSSLKNILRGEFGGVRLFEIGISFDRNGKLEIDSEKFEDNIDKVDLDELFKGDDGVFKQMTSTLDRYTSFSDGLIKTKRDALNENIADYNIELEKLDDRYNRLYSQYLSEFNVINNLQAELDSLSSLF